MDDMNQRTSSKKYSRPILFQFQKKTKASTVYNRGKLKPK